MGELRAELTHVADAIRASRGVNDTTGGSLLRRTEDTNHKVANIEGMVSQMNQAPAFPTEVMELFRYMQTEIPR